MTSYLCFAKSPFASRLLLISLVLCAIALVCSTPLEAIQSTTLMPLTTTPSVNSTHYRSLQLDMSSINTHSRYIKLTLSQISRKIIEYGSATVSVELSPSISSLNGVYVRTISSDDDVESAAVSVSSFTSHGFQSTVVNFPSSSSSSYSSDIIVELYLDGDWFPSWLDVTATVFIPDNDDDDNNNDDNDHHHHHYPDTADNTNTVNHDDYTSQSTVSSPSIHDYFSKGCTASIFRASTTLPETNSPTGISLTFPTVSSSAFSRSSTLTISSNIASFALISSSTNNENRCQFGSVTTSLPQIDQDTGDLIISVPNHHHITTPAVLSCSNVVLAYDYYQLKKSSPVVLWVTNDDLISDVVVNVPKPSPTPNSGLTDDIIRNISMGIGIAAAVWVLLAARYYCWLRKAHPSPKRTASVAAVSQSSGLLPASIPRSSTEQQTSINPNQVNIV